MKKYTSIIALCMVVLLCVPSVDAFAYSDGAFEVRTRQSVLGFWDDTALDIIQQVICNYDGTDIDKVYERLAELETLKSSNSLLANTTFGFACMYYGNGSGLYVTYFRDNYAGDAYIMQGISTKPITVSQTSAGYPFYVAGRYSSVSTGYVSTSCRLDDLDSGSWQIYNGLYAYQSDNGLWSGSYASNNNYLIIDSSIPVYNNWESIDKGNSYVNSESKAREYVSLDKSNLTDFFSSSLPYSDAQGNIVTPSSVDFSDTTYNGGISFDYQQTHLYTEYNNAQGANETCVFKWALDSRSQSITQTTTDWKMHYYVVVNWHWTQATDSSVYTPLLSGGSGGQMAFEFDDTPEFIMQGKSKISIWDLVQNVPTVSSVRDEDIVSLAVAVSCLNGNIVNSVWKDIFGQSGQYVGDVASEIITGGKLEVQGVGELGGSFINNLFNPAYYYALDDLRINLVAHPWSETLAIHGGNGDFDLNLCTNESYGTTQGHIDDGGTPNDPSDDTHYPTNNVPTQNNVVVPVTYPTSGGNVTVYSVVQVPDGGGGGNSINYSPTFSPSIVMDSGLDDLKETVDAYPQVPNQHFWDYFLVFKDNAFLDATSDFFGALPNELSSLLISSIGIIGVFAIYRFVRRR